MLRALRMRNAIRKSRMSCEMAACLTLSTARLWRILESSKLTELSWPNLVELCDNAGDDDDEAGIVAALLLSANGTEHIDVGACRPDEDGGGWSLAGDSVSLVAKPW